MDGISLLSHLTKQTPIERACLYWHYPHYHAGMPGSSIRKGDYKLIEFFEDGSLELYDLQADPGEKENLASKRPELAEELHEQLVRWRKDVGAQMMKPAGDD